MATVSRIPTPALNIPRGDRDHPGVLQPQFVACTRNSDIFQLDADGNIRYLNLKLSTSEVSSEEIFVMRCKGGPPGKGKSELNDKDVSVDDAIHLCLNASETMIALSGHQSIKVIHIRDRSAPRELLSGVTNSDDVSQHCSVDSIGVSLLRELGENVRIVHISWHPFNDAQLVVLLSTNQLCIFDVDDGDLCYPEQCFDVTPPSTSGAAVSFHFGNVDSGPKGGGGWDLFTAYILSAHGDIFTLCPIICGQPAAGEVCRDLLSLTTDLIDNEFSKAISHSDNVDKDDGKKSFTNERFVQEMRVQQNWLRKVIQSRDLELEISPEENDYINSQDENAKLAIQTSTWRLPAKLRGPLPVIGYPSMECQGRPNGIASSIIVVPVSGIVKCSNVHSNEKENTNVDENEMSSSKSRSKFFQTPQRIILRSFESGEVEVLVSAVPPTPDWGIANVSADTQEISPLVMIEIIDLLFPPKPSNIAQPVHINNGVILKRVTSTPNTILASNCTGIYAIHLWCLHELLSECIAFQTQVTSSNKVRKHLSTSTVVAVDVIECKSKDNNICSNSRTRNRMSEPLAMFVGSAVLDDASLNDTSRVIACTSDGVLRKWVACDLTMDVKILADLVNDDESELNIRPSQRGSRMCQFRSKYALARQNAMSTSKIPNINGSSGIPMTSIDSLENAYEKHHQQGMILWQLQHSLEQLRSDTTDACVKSTAHLQNLEEDIKECMEYQVATEVGLKNVAEFAENLKERSQSLLRRAQRVQAHPSIAEREMSDEVMTSMLQIKQTTKPSLKELTMRVNSICEFITKSCGAIGQKVKLSKEREDSCFQVLSYTADIIAENKNKVDILKAKLSR